MISSVFLRRRIYELNVSFVTKTRVILINTAKTWTLKNFTIFHRRLEETSYEWFQVQAQAIQEVLWGVLIF